MSNIVTYKLLNGQEIIGQAVDKPKLLTGDSRPVSDGNVYLEDVRVIEYGFSGPGNLQMGLAPFAISALNGVVGIKESAIVASFNPDNIPKPIMDAYLKEVTGIEIAGADSVPGIRR